MIMTYELIRGQNKKDLEKTERKKVFTTDIYNKLTTSISNCKQSKSQFSSI